MSSIPMKQAEATAYFDGAMFHERRREPRRAVSAHVTGVISDVRDPTRPKRICALELRNLSAHGLGAVSMEPLPVGARIVLFSPPHGVEPGLDLRGMVVRCRERSSGYDVGVALIDERRAA